MDKDKS